MTDIDEYRRLAAEWCDFACNNDKGRLLSDPVYQSIVEKRDKGPGYSSCADLAHWLLFRLGCRSPFINREEHLGWKSEVNVYRLVACYAAESAPFDYEPKRGDVVIMWPPSNSNNAHVVVFDEMIENGRYSSWEAGKGPMAKEAWRGREYIEVKHCERSLYWPPIQRIVRLDKVEFDAPPELPSGELLESLDPNYFKGSE